MKAELKALNTTAVASCTYNFSSILIVTVTNTTTTVGNETMINSTVTVSVNATMFLQAALLVHNVSLEAYIGVINTMSNASVVQTVASIIAVEARHAAYLSTVLNLDPFPKAFEPSLPPANITSKPLPFTEDCPFESLLLPVARDMITGCSGTSTNATAAPTAQPSTANPTNSTGPTTAPQSAASSVTASSALVVTIVAAVVAAAIHAVSL